MLLKLLWPFQEFLVHTLMEIENNLLIVKVPKVLKNNIIHSLLRHKKILVKVWKKSKEKQKWQG